MIFLYLHYIYFFVFLVVFFFNLLTIYLILVNTLLLLLQLCLLTLPLQVFLRNQVGQSSKQRIQEAWSTTIHHIKWCISRFRGAYRTHATSEVEFFVILVNGFQPLYNVTGCSVLLVVKILDLPRHFIIIVIIITIIINIIFITFIITKIFEQQQFTVLMVLFSEFFHVP